MKQCVHALSGRVPKPTQPRRREVHYSYIISPAKKQLRYPSSMCNKCRRENEGDWTPLKTSSQFGAYLTDGERDGIRSGTDRNQKPSFRRF
jgi:hypothetical protein